MKQKMVWVTGLEPATSTSQKSRATNCATPRSRFYFSTNISIFQSSVKNVVVFISCVIIKTLWKVILKRTIKKLALSPVQF